MARTAAPGTRERILDVAGALFYTEGVRAVGMSRIIGEVGCGKNLLYAHFPSKTDLVAAYLGRFRERRDRAEAQALREAGDDPGERLVALVAEIAGRLRRPDFRGCPFRNLLTEFPAGDELPERMAREYLAQTCELVGRLAGATGVPDPEGLADRIWLIIDGLYASGFRERAAEVAPDMVREAIAAARDPRAPAV
ncbi:TetR/AcrR family transcriptional regulator [Amycolatopsis thermalba]|uniref:TetR/AcrR family transcriptional regulator n=1 Tax=Amycolatopsis thermalba TaxID=944492 RepID=A0ABY4P0G0_9PSEU|nr:MULTISPECIES: TetR/AcrR family transcriptional regulator [Amycolatopsis]UQS25830.1 TetR/AcrR family transcriptional regulator [Amycolatopsis thermalba]